MWRGTASLSEMHISTPCLRRLQRRPTLTSLTFKHNFNRCRSIVWHPRLHSIASFIFIFCTTDKPTASRLLWIWLLGKTRPSNCISWISSATCCRRHRFTPWDAWESKSNDRCQQGFCTRRIQSGDKGSADPSLPRQGETHWCLPYHMYSFYLFRGTVHGNLDIVSMSYY